MFNHIYKLLVRIYLRDDAGVSVTTIDDRDIKALDAAGWLRWQSSLVFLHDDGLDALRSEAEDRGEWAKLASAA